MDIDLSPPPMPAGNSGTTLDRSHFQKSIPLLAARVQPTQVGQIRGIGLARRAILDIPKTRSVEPDPEDQRMRLILLRSSKMEDLDKEAVAYIKEQAEKIVPYDLKLDYDFWNADEILSVLLPPSVKPPSAFTSTGHIIHLNLRDELLPYKHLIGEVLLSKHPTLRTVVNKLENIDTKFRFFHMELLAGEPDYMVTLAESRCIFKFDFRTVYYNGRLSTEHERLVTLLPPTALVADVFGGVGPFAIPAAKKGCAVLLNDLNPQSVKWGKENVKLNNVGGLVRVSELDGNDFIRRSVLDTWHNPFPPYATPLSARQRDREARKSRQKPVGNAAPRQTAQDETASGPGATAPTAYKDSEFSSVPNNEPKDVSATQVSDPPLGRRAPTNYILNLPSTSLSFLSSFRGFLRPLMEEPGFSDVYTEDKGMPMVHVYCFAKKMADDAAFSNILTRASTSLAYPVAATSRDVSLHYVRNVAPAKEMWRLDFRLPWEVATAKVEEDALRAEQEEMAERARADWEDILENEDEFKYDEST